MIRIFIGKVNVNKLKKKPKNTNLKSSQSNSTTPPKNNKNLFAKSTFKGKMIWLNLRKKYNNQFKMLNLKRRKKMSENGLGD